MTDADHIVIAGGGHVGHRVAQHFDGRGHEVIEQFRVEEA